MGWMMPPRSRTREVPSGDGEPPAADTPTASIEEVVRGLRPRIRHLFASYRVPHVDAEDILQETLLAALPGWGEIRCKEGWILVVLRHRISGYFRQRRTRGNIESLDEGEHVRGGPTVAPQERREMLWDLDRAIGNLSPRHQELLWLRYGEGLSAAEIARAMDYSVASVRKLADRSIGRVKEMIDGSRPAVPIRGQRK
jgi:RNA polymerase sigma factor (sigma-70 family)